MHWPDVELWCLTLSRSGLCRESRSLTQSLRFREENPISIYHKSAVCFIQVILVAPHFCTVSMSDQPGVTPKLLFRSTPFLVPIERFRICICRWLVPTGSSTESTSSTIANRTTVMLTTRTSTMFGSQQSAKFNMVINH